MTESALHLAFPLGLEASNGGLFVSRGVGVHPSRTIQSYELIYVRQGALHLHEDGRHFEVNAGETLLLWPGRLHGGTSPFAPDLKFYWVHFTLPDGPQRGSAAEVLLEIPQHASVERADHLSGIFQRLLNDQQIYGVQPLPDSLTILLMLWELKRSRVAVKAADGAPQQLAASADQWIRTHFHESISASEIAAHLDCNADYLGRVYRATFGRTLTDAVHERRMLHAAILLAEDRLSIAQVAYACGFDDSGYFRRLFKRSKGMTPNAFRRLHVRVHVNTA
ncbi:AraC family transcriptional regulator [Paraburkholderia sp. DHOC27]|uniref:helix-turn-helix domain-containing protein n=1 Tax=Paraburkholderia sp. DHOC27 TaxID=2303330 RepID=UPI000E3DDFE8|nr:AraC family transcriptional regulator [Paraburkholderia sp. DHOC27]RFU46462.1 AraC family transcriptional regulator [Paraburkholderia sp. DHOC27]